MAPKTEIKQPIAVRDQGPHVVLGCYNKLLNFKLSPNAAYYWRMKKDIEYTGTDGFDTFKRVWVLSSNYAYIPSITLNHVEPYTQEEWYQIDWWPEVTQNITASCHKEFNSIDIFDFANIEKELEKFIAKHIPNSVKFIKED